MNLLKPSLVFWMLAVPTAAFSGVTKTVCTNGKYRVCIEDPNSTYQMKLLSGDDRHFLDEIEPYELFEDSAGLFSFSYQEKMLTDVVAGIEVKLECLEAKPGTCSGWQF